jgi:hypothetical protein
MRFYIVCDFQNNKKKANEPNYLMGYDPAGGSVTT